MTVLMVDSQDHAPAPVLVSVPLWLQLHASYVVPLLQIWEGCATTTEEGKGGSLLRLLDCRCCCTTTMKVQKHNSLFLLLLLLLLGLSIHSSVALERRRIDR